MAHLVHTDPLINALKKLLKTRGLTYGDVAKAINLSEASVKRLFSEETFTLRRLEEICIFLEIDFFELAKLARGAASSINEMSVKQERALAGDPRLLGVFYLVFNGWQLDDVVASYETTRPEVIGLLLQLDKLGLVELLAGDHIRLKVPHSLTLRIDGPIKEIYGKSVMGDFLQVDFAKAGGHFRFEFRELSKESFALLRRKIDRMATEFNEMAELDSYLPSQQRETIGLALGTRPWVISMVTGLKKRKSTTHSG